MPCEHEDTIWKPRREVRTDLCFKSSQNERAIDNLNDTLILDILLSKPCAKSLQSCRLFAALWTIACQTPLSWDSPGMNTGVVCYALLLWIFLTQEFNPCLLRLLHWNVGLLSLAPNLWDNNFLLFKPAKYYKFIKIYLIKILSLIKFY